MKTLPAFCYVGMFLLAALSCGALRAVEPAAPGEVLPFLRVGPENYQSYVRNWDEKARPILIADIETPSQWNAVMAPAAVMGKHPPFAPKDQQFAKNRLLLVARVIPGSSDMAKVFKVESAILKEDTLTLTYTFTPPTAKASFSIKNYFAVWTPKKAVKKIAFVENGKRIGVLDLAHGQWSMPKFKLEP